MAEPRPPRKTALDRIAASFLAPPESPDELGRLGVFRVMSVLGKGGMGMVFRAEDPALKRTVALKVMLPEFARRITGKERFLREARAAAALEHDHIITIHQVGEDRGVPFIAMSFLKGMSLDDWLKQKRPLSMPQILRIGRETAKGLDAAHTRGLIHRDIKPANLWLDGSAKGRIKILDFGLARAEKEDTALTRSGQIVGTPQYMSPEQAAGNKVDGRSDLFSLGVLLYRLCTGVMPFMGDNVMAVLTALAVVDPPSAVSLNPETPAAFSDLIDRLLRKDPDQRIASAREVVDAIAKIERERALQKLGTAPTEASFAPVSSSDSARAAASQAFNFDDSADSFLSDDDFKTAREHKERTSVAARRPAWLWPAALGGCAVLALAIVGIAIAMRSPPVEVAIDRGPPAARKTPLPKPIEPVAITPKPVAPIEPKPVAPIEPKPIAPKSSSPSRSVSGFRFDALPLIDVALDSVAGEWKLSPLGELSVDNTRLARIEIPYRPPAEYDLRVDFTRTGGNGDVNQVLVRGVRQFSYHLGMGGNLIAVFQMIDGKSRDHPNAVKKDAWLTNGRRYRSLVEVRKDGVKAFLDDAFVTQVRTNYANVHLSSSWNLRDTLAIGLGAHDSATTFHRVQITELSGTGTFLRTQDPAARRIVARRDFEQASGTSTVAKLQPFATLPVGHQVTRVLFAPDGSPTAASRQSGLYSWDARTLAQRAVLHEVNVFEGITYSGDGAYRAVCGSDPVTKVGAVKLFDRTGRLLRDLPGNVGPTHYVAFSPDNQWLAVSAGSGTGERVDCTLRLYRTATGEPVPLSQPAKSTNPFHQIEFSADGRYLAAGSWGSAYLWDLDDRSKAPVTLSRVGKSVRAVAFHPDRKTVLTGSGEGIVRLFNVADGKKVAEHDLGYCIDELRFSPDGSILAAAGGEIGLFDVRAFARLATLTGHEKGWLRCDFSADGQTLITGGYYETTVRLCDVSACSGPPWKSLFNGKDLSNWVIRPETRSEIVSVVSVDGEPAIRIPTETSKPVADKKGPQTIKPYMSNEHYVRDFDLRAEFHFDPSRPHSSATIGFVLEGGGKGGCTYKFDSKRTPPGRNIWGMQFDEAIVKRGTILPSSAGAEVGRMSALQHPPSEWNKVEVIRIDDAVVCLLNDRLIGALANLRTKYDGRMDADLGRNGINLQVSDGVVFFRQVELREIHELPPEITWERIANGPEPARP